MRQRSPAEIKMEIIALTFDTLGKIMVSFTAIMVHHRVFKEKRIDEKVLVEMHHERNIGILGVGLILTAFFIKLYLHYY